MRHYIVLVYEGDGTWKEAGTFQAHSADAACKAALTEQQVPAARAVAVPSRSWKPEQFNAQMRFVFDGKAGTKDEQGPKKPTAVPTPAPAAPAPAAPAPVEEPAAPPDDAA